MKVANILIIITVLFIAVLSYFLFSPFFAESGEKKNIDRAKLCGDGICDFNENPNNCCIDCGCYGTDEICNKKKNVCESRGIFISDEDAVSLVRFYLRDFNYSIQEIESLGNFTYNNEVGKQVIVVYSKNNRTLWASFFVNNDGKVKEIGGLTKDIWENLS